MLSFKKKEKKSQGEKNPTNYLLSGTQKIDLFSPFFFTGKFSSDIGPGNITYDFI